MWAPYVLQVCQRHGFGCRTLSPGLPGTFPTFIVELDPEGFQRPFESVVVKFFGPLFNGGDSFRIERDVGYWLEQQTLAIPSPAILAEGQLDADWCYLIFEHVHGVSIGQVRDQLSQGDWLSVARQMGEYMRMLHALTVDRLAELSPASQPSWDGYASFLIKQRTCAKANHRTWNDLPTHLLDQIEGFLLPVEQLVDLSSSPHLIHADLTADHLLGSLVTNNWQTLAIIDWGDAMTGNLLYELVALHLDLFRSDRYLLYNCLDTYNLPQFYCQDFPRKALSVVLLHQFPMPAWVYAPHRDARTLQELAERLFSV